MKDTKRVKGAEQYRVTRNGDRLINTDSGRELKTSGGSVTVYKTEMGGYSKTVRVSVLVKLAWSGDVVGDDIIHLDGDRKNCDVDNLRWATRGEAVRHRQTIISGEDHHNSGKKFGKITRRRMSQSKTGENHPKFRGWYKVKGVKYSSLQEAAKVIGVSYKTIKRRVDDARYGEYVFMPKPLV